MAKNKDAVPAAAVVPPAPETAALAPATEQALATVPQSAPVPVPASAPAGLSGFAAIKALALRLPEEVRPRVMALKRPTPVELMDIVMALPEASQEAMMTLVAKTNPEKQGLHTSTTGFEPTALRLFHGVGSDPLRPRQTLPGQFYSADSRIIGEKFDAVPLALYEGHILWPEKSQDNNKQESKAPICVSIDRRMGSKYGSCDTCPLNPQVRQYSQGGCMREVTAYLLDRDLTSIYELKFSKTSESAGRALMNIMKKSNNLWDRWFTFEAKERTEKGNKWYVIQAGPTVDASKVVTDPATHPLFLALSKIIDVDIIYAAMANTYDRAKNSTDAASGAPPPGVTSEGFDEAAFLKGAVDAVPDYSKDI
jgi:hypothetical protein